MFNQILGQRLSIHNSNKKKIEQCKRIKKFQRNKNVFLLIIKKSRPLKMLNKFLGQCLSIHNSNLKKFRTVQTNKKNSNKIKMYFY